ncbi:MAG: hypothetical protein RLY97_593, partial [Pseudomonadota bacterium]
WTIIGFTRQGSKVELNLQNDFEGREIDFANFIFWDVKAILVEGEPFQGALMQAADGEILGLDFGANQIEMVIAWNDFQTRRSFTNVCCIHFAEYQFSSVSV